MSFTVLDPAVVDAFQADGAVVVRNALSPEWIELLRRTMPAILEGARVSSQQTNTSSLSRTGMWRACEPFARFLFHSPVGELAAACMRTRVARLYEDLLIYKEAAGDGTTAWHRDAPHWPIAGQQLSSVWLSLESVGRGTGAMQFVAESHFDEDDRMGGRSIFVSKSDLAGRKFISIETDPGDVVIFNPRALHTVESSVEQRARRTFTLRFAGDDVRWRPRAEMYHAWMYDCGLAKGGVLDHPWFPVVYPGPQIARS